MKYQLFFAFVLLLVANVVSLAQEASLTGRVVDQRGDALRAARVTLTRDASFVREAATDSDGRFAFTGLPPGEYQLLVTALGFGEQRQRVTLAAPANEQKVSLTLAPASLAETMTVTPARAEVRLLDTPASVSLLDAKDVTSAAAQTVDDLLRQVPGFSIFRRSSSVVANPTTQGVSLRGAGASGASRTLVLTDGVPLNDAFGGWVYWDRVPRAALDRIELVRGGASDLYGSDALSGVINLLTQKAAANRFNIEASYGTRDTADVTFFGSHKWKGFGVAVTGEATRTDGWFIVAPEVRGAVDEAAASQHRVLSLRLQQDFGEHNSIFARGSLFDEDRKNGTVLQRNDTATESLAVGGKARTSDGSDWNLALFANQQRFHQSFTGVAANRNTENLTRLQFVPARDAGLSFTWSRLSFAKHFLVAGVDVRGVRGTSDEIVYANNRATTFTSAGGRQRRAGFFVQDIFNITSRLVLTASGRYDNWRNSAGGSVARALATGAVTPRFFAPRAEEAFSPRLALSYTMHARATLHAAAYRAFRAPTLNELYRAFRVGDTQTNANERLTAERLTGGEAGVNLSSQRRVQTRLTGFWTETVNPITNFTLSVTPTLITRERRNLGRVRSRGFEAESEFEINNHWRLSAGYLLAAATVRRAPQDRNLEGLRIPQVPRHQFTLQTTYTHPKYLTAALQFRASGRQFDDDQNRLPLGGFALVDVTLARPLHRFFEVFVAVQNLFDVRYAVGRTPIETIGAPRLVRGGVRLRLER